MKTFISGPGGELSDRQPKERLKDFQGLMPRPSPGNRRRVLEKRENPIKISFPILRFRELLRYDTRRKTSENKLIFLVLYKKMKMKNGVMGSSHPFAQKKNV